MHVCSHVVAVLRFGMVPRRYREVQGTWGDIPEQVVMELRSPTVIQIHWIPPSTRPIEPSGYLCQVSTRPDFFGSIPTVLEQIVSTTSAILYNTTARKAASWLYLLLTFYWGLWRSCVRIPLHSEWLKNRSDKVCKRADVAGFRSAAWEKVLWTLLLVQRWRRRPVDSYDAAVNICGRVRQIFPFRWLALDDM